MKTVMKSISFIFTIMIAYSCEKTIQFNALQIKPKIVVNGFVSPHRGISLRVEKSRSILDQDDYFEAISDAKVLLYENDVLVKQLEYKSVIDTFRKQLDYDVEKKIPFENGHYSDNSVQIKPGATYKLEISKEGFDPVWCETTVPEPVDISDFTIDYKEGIKQEYGPKYIIDMKLKIKDIAADENFYSLNVYVQYGIELGYLRLPGYGYDYGGYNSYGGSNPDGDSGEQPEFSKTDTIVEKYSDFMGQWFSPDPLFASGDAMDAFDNYIYSNGLFTDELINGKDYLLSFGEYGNYTVHKDVGEFIRVNIALDNLTKELYLYYRSREEHSYAKDDPFAEPVPVYSNVVGGLGIFGSESTSFIQGFFGDYPVTGKTYIDENTYRELRNSQYY